MGTKRIKFLGKLPRYTTGLVKTPTTKVVAKFNSQRCPVTQLSGRNNNCYCFISSFFRHLGARILSELISRTNKTKLKKEMKTNCNADISGSTNRCKKKKKKKNNNFSPENKVPKNQQKLKINRSQKRYKKRYMYDVQYLFSL